MLYKHANFDVHLARHVYDHAVASDNIIDNKRLNFYFIWSI
jgi:hypothetical protein